jgi:hypothetical protein
VIQGTTVATDSHSCIILLRSRTVRASHAQQQHEQGHQKAPAQASAFQDLVGLTAYWNTTIGTFAIGR